jgi:hypothetical protein
MPAGDPVYADEIGFIQQVRFTSSGTFTKASYPGATRARVRVVGGGGGGGGSQTNAAGNNSAGGGGQGGAYAESWLDISALASSVTVTVGAAGTAGGTGGSGSAGNGGTSSFGTSVSAAGGTGGLNGGTSTTWFFVVGGSGAQAMTGDIQVGGQDGFPGVRNGTSYVAGQQCGGAGGGSALGSGGLGSTTSGGDGKGYGGGGGASASAQSVAGRTGGAGTKGIVIVDLFS